MNKWTGFRMEVVKKTVYFKDGHLIYVSKILNKVKRELNHLYLSPRLCFSLPLFVGTLSFLHSPAPLVDEIWE